MLKRGDVFSETLIEEFKRGTDLKSICDSLTATLDNDQDKLLSLVIKVNNQYLREPANSDDEEVYVGHL